MMLLGTMKVWWTLLRRYNEGLVDIVASSVQMLMMMMMMLYDVARYNEGLVDIVASSVQMVGEPRQVFPSKTLSLGSPVL